MGGTMFRNVSAKSTPDLSVTVENVGEEILVHRAGAAVGPQLQQGFQAFHPGFAGQRRLVPRQAAQDAQGFDARQHAVFRCLAPDIGPGRLGAGGTLVLDQICRTSGKWVLRQKILHRLPEEDWRMQSNRFVADQPQ